MHAFLANVSPLLRYLDYQCGIGNIDNFGTLIESRKIFVHTFLGFYNGVLLPEILRHRTPALGYRAMVSTLIVVGGRELTRKVYTDRLNETIPLVAAQSRIVVSIDVVERFEE